MEGTPTFPKYLLPSILGYRRCTNCHQEALFADPWLALDKAVNETQPGFPLVRLMIRFPNCFINSLQLQFPMLTVIIFPKGTQHKTWGLQRHFWMGEELRVKKCKLQSVDIFRVDLMIWGPMGKIFKIQTGLHNGRQIEALSMFKTIPLFPPPQQI